MFSESSNRDRRASAEAALVQVLLSVLAGATWSWLAFPRRCDAIGEFAIAFSLTCLTTIAIFACVEVRALASVTAYSLPGFHIPGSAGPRYMHAPRSGADRTWDRKGASALISFPSRPGATALVLAAATRGLGAWRCPFLAFNMWVLVSTLNEGGHWLTDVIAGGGSPAPPLPLRARLTRLCVDVRLRRSGAWSKRAPWRRPDGQSARRAALFC